MYETGCQGLLVAAALERVGSAEGGKVIHVYQTGNPQTQSLNAMNFDKATMDNMLTLNMYHLRSMEQGQDISVMHCDVKKSDGAAAEIEEKPSEEKDEKMTEAKSDEKEDKDGDEPKPAKVPFRQRLREESMASYELLKGKETMDGLLIASKQHPTALLLSLLPYVKPSRPFVAFSPYKEPLMDAYLKLKETGKAIMVTLSESWLRNHQVLPSRTHPEVTMSGGGGYVLSGIVVDNSAPSSSGWTHQEDGNSSNGRKAKRFRRR